VERFFGGLVDRTLGWSEYHPANARGTKGVVPGFLLAPHANSGGQDAAGILAIPSGGTTTALGTVGVNFAGTPNPTQGTNFGAIVTALVIKNLMEVLRDRTVILQEGSFIRASSVPGTNQLRYTVFADIGVAEDLLEGVPPQTEGLQWDTQEFTGKQKGKLVAITDLAEQFSPFELYRVAAEKIAWNAIDTAEKDALALVTGAGGITLAGVTADAAASITAAVVAMKRANIPMFPDGTYHAFITPEEAAAVMNQTGEKGWLDTMKYANGKALLNAELGQFRGVRFIETNRIPVSGTAKTIFFGPDAWIWGDYQTIRAYRVAPGGDHADPLAQRGLVGWKGMWGLKLNEFTGTPAIGPASNPKGIRWGAVDLTT
jgi:N4-gp56 family major capsid protein